MMDQALAPRPDKKSSDQSPSQPTHLLVSHHRQLSAKTPTTSSSQPTEAIKSAPETGPNSITSSQPTATAEPVKKTSAAVDETKPAEAALTPPTPIVTEPLPVFLSLPIAVCFAMDAGPATQPATTTTTNTSASENILDAVTALGAKAGGAATAALDLKSAGVSQAGDAEKLPAEKNALLKTLTTATDAQPVTEPETKSALPAAVTDNKESAATTTIDSISGKDKLARTAASNAAEKGGMGVALTDSPMKKSENTNKVAGLDVKVLPGSATELAREKNLPPHLVISPTNATENRPGDGNVNLPVASQATVETKGGINVVDLPSLADARMRTLERTQDMVTLHSMRLVESKSDSLQVTIKPAVGTELSLELRERNGTIEAHATLQRGDFPLMNQHWAELQQKLEQRGIKLAPLDGEANFLANDNGNARQQAAQEEAASHASAFAEFATAGNWGGASARLATDYDGWESWA